LGEEGFPGSGPTLLALQLLGAIKAYLRVSP
jgi:hypothetical protein